MTQVLPHALIFRLAKRRKAHRPLDLGLCQGARVARRIRREAGMAQ